MSKPFDISHLPDSVWNRQFDLAARTPLTWQLSARQLKRAADIVYAVSEEATQQYLHIVMHEVNRSRTLSEKETGMMLDSGLTGVYYMLIGLAIENLAKGVLVSIDPDCVDAKGEFKHKSHSLMTLIEKCKLRLSPKEKDVLRSLTDYTVWRGRYFIPLAASDLHPRRRESDCGWVQPGQGLGRKDRELIESLYNRLWKLLESERMKVAATKAEEGGQIIGYSKSSKSAIDFMNGGYQYAESCYGYWRYVHGPGVRDPGR